MSEVRSVEGHFLGFDPRGCGEHRTVGAHRAWCLDCGEWCYPHVPCVRCQTAGREIILSVEDEAAYFAVVRAAIQEREAWRARRGDAVTAALDALDTALDALTPEQRARVLGGETT